jgi:hypothetical protein
MYTHRSPVQIKSHGQKLYSKLKPGDDIFHDLNEYERSTSTHLDPGDNGTPPYVPLHHFMLAQQQQKNKALIQAPEELLARTPDVGYESDEDEDDYPFMVEEESDEENLPPAVAALKPDPLSSSKPSAMSIQSFLDQSDQYSRGRDSPLWQSHFGSPKGISFLNDSPPEFGSTTRSNELATSLAKRPAQNQQDVHAAMVLCQMDSISKSLQPAPLAPTATRPTPFAPKSTSSQLSFSSSAASSAFEPISLKSMDKQRFDESLLAACFPEILQEVEDDDEGSNVVTPTAFAEV